MEWGLGGSIASIVSTSFWPMEETSNLDCEKELKSQECWLPTILLFSQSNSHLLFKQLSNLLHHFQFFPNSRFLPPQPHPFPRQLLSQPNLPFPTLQLHSCLSKWELVTISMGKSNPISLFYSLIKVLFLNWGFSFTNWY